MTLTQMRDAHTQRAANRLKIFRAKMSAMFPQKAAQFTSGDFDFMAQMDRWMLIDGMLSDWYDFHLKNSGAL